MPPTVDQRIMHVPTDHPAWKAIDDDDWNGHTFANWLRGVNGKTVVIYPPRDYGDRIGRFLMALLNAGAERITNGWADQPNPGNFCDQCLPLGDELDSSLKDVRDTLKRLADAAEAAVSADMDMPTYESTMDEFQNMLDEARQLLREGA